MGDGTAAMCVFIGWSPRVDPDGNIGQFYLPKSAYNAGQVPLPEVEPLVIKARQVYDQNERKKLYSDIQKRAAENVYSMIPHLYAITWMFAGQRVGNLDALWGGEGKPRFANLWT